MKPMKNKDYWTRVGLGLVMAAVILAALVWGLANLGSWLKGFKKTDNMVVQAQLYQLAAVEKKYLADKGRPAADWNSLAEYGFKPDKQILMLVTVVDLDWGSGCLKGYWALANHASGTEVFYVAGFGDQDVRALPGAEPLRDASFAATIKSETPLRLSGPPFAVISVPLPGCSVRERQAATYCGLERDVR